MHLINETKTRVAVIGNFGVSVPIVAITLEELIGFSVKRFISIKMAGTLQKTSESEN